MADSLQAFKQSGAATLAATASSQVLQLVGAGDVAFVTNLGTTTAWVVFGAAGQTLVAAVGTGYPVQGGGVRAIGINGLTTQCAIILASGTASVVVEVGSGAFH